MTKKLSVITSNFGTKKKLNNRVLIISKQQSSRGYFYSARVFLFFITHNFIYNRKLSKCFLVELTN
jgi:hypothetical protein